MRRSKSKEGRHDAGGCVSRRSSRGYVNKRRIPNVPIPMCCHATHHALSRPYNCPIINSPCYFFSGLFLSWRLIRLHVSVLVPFLFPARRGGQRRALVSGECPRRGRYKDTGLLSQYLMHPPLLQNDVRGKNNWCATRPPGVTASHS